MADRPHVTLSDIARLRLVSQLLERGNARSPARVASWMGAMQAQDLQMSLWAVGVRMRAGTVDSVVSALNRGTIIRTHVLRPTWHLVPARDLGWMLDLTAPQVRAGIAARHRQLGLTPRAISKSHAIIERTISGQGPATRAQLVEALESGGFSSLDNRLAHLLMLAELDQLICSGPITDGGPTYALMSDRVKRSVRLDRDEALEVLVSRYLNGHGPATLKDYAWWSGLAMGDVRRSFEIVRGRFAFSRVDGAEYWHRRDLRDTARGHEGAFLLPAYDEFMIAYSDRSPSIVPGRIARAISSNGVFRPMVVVGGRVIGTWRRIRSNRKAGVNVGLFANPSMSLKRMIEQAAWRYASFQRCSMEVTFSQGGV